MKLSEITRKTDQELRDYIQAEHKAMAETLIESRTKEVKNVKALHAHKKAIARALTIAREREIAAQEATQ